MPALVDDPMQSLRSPEALATTPVKQLGQQPAAPSVVQPDGQQVVQPQQPTTAQPDPTNPDAPKEPIVDPTTGQANSYYGKALQVVQSFDQYIKNGGDITKYTADDFNTLSAAVKAIPGFQNDLESPAVMNMLFRDAKKKNIAIDAGKQGILPTSLADIPRGALATGQFIGHQIVENAPGAAGAALEFIGKDLLWNTSKFVYDKTLGAGVPALEDIGDMFHGDFSMSHEKNVEAKQTNAMVQSVVQQGNNYFMNLPGSVQDMSALYGLASRRAHATNPDEAAQLDFRQSEILRGQVLRDKQAEQNIVDARNATSDIYKAIGASDFASRIATQKPEESDLFVMGQLTDPMTYATLGIEPAGKAVASQFFKAGIRLTGLTEATAAVSKIEHQITGVESARTSMMSIITGDTSKMPTSTLNGYEANLQRLNAVQSNLQKDHAAAKAEYQAKVVAVNKQMDTMAKANPLRQVTGQILQATGALGEMPAAIGKFVETLPETLVKNFMPNADEATQKTAAAAVKRWGEGGLALLTAATGMHMHGDVMGALLGGAPKVVGEVAKFVMPSIEQLGRFAHDLGTVGEQYAMGQQTLPFWKAMSEKLTGVSSFLASKMDNTLVYSIPSAVTHAVPGAAVGGAFGLLTGGGDPQKFQQGVGTGGVLGMAGGGLGQIRRYNSLPELRQAAIGDRSRFLGSMTTPNKELFSKLHPENQLAVASYGMAHPDLDIHFEDNPGGSNGSYTANNPRPTVLINVASKNPLAAVASHEVAHHVAAHGLGSDVDSYVRGNPVTGQIGITTALDADGHPLIEHDARGVARYVQNAQFENYKADYNARKLRDNPGAPLEDDYGIAQEMFADLHAEYITNREGLQKMARGHIPSDLVSENVVSNWLTKMGMGADPTTGHPIPTSSLEGAVGLKRIIDDFYRQRQYKKMPVDTGGDRGDTKTVVGNMVKGTPEFDRIQKAFDSTGEFHRNPDGTIATDLAGRPRVKSEKEADADAARLGQAINDLYQRQPGLEGVEGDNYLKVVTDRDGKQYRRGQRVPEPVYGEMERTNQYNANQLLNWRRIDAGMQRNDGSMYLTTYNTASKGKGKYTTVAARERAFVPIYSEISLKTGQVNIKAYDPELLQANLNKRLRSAKGKELYPGGNIGPAIEDVRTYLGNLANDRPGETGIGLQKKGFINELFGFNADANPYAADIAKRSPDVLKNFRLDRINRVSEVRGASEPFHAATYEQVRSFMQPREEPIAGSGARYQPSGGAPVEEALPGAQEEPGSGIRFQPQTKVKNPTEKAYLAARDVHKSERTPEQHDIIARRTMHEWNSQKDTVPLSVRRDDNGEVIVDKDHNIQYKTQDFGLLDAPVVKALVKKFGKEEGFKRATDLLASRLAEQYKKWENDPALQPAIGWYSGMRDRLQSSFGATIDKFANMLAATSAQEGVKTNFNYTLEALRKMSTGDYDQLMGQFREFATDATDRIMGDDSIRNKKEALRKEINKFGNPKGGGIGDVPLKDNGKKYGINSQKVLHALTDFWVDQAGGPKTSNFGENLSWRSIDPTIDVWASRTARRLLYEGDVKRWRIHPAAEGGVGGKTKGGHDDYTLSEDSYRKAADHVGMNPDDTQAFMWFGEKNHYADRNWTTGTGATLGDFRNIMDMMKFDRYQAGITTNRGETAEQGRPKLLAARQQLEQSIQGLGKGIVAQRVTESEGLYGASREPTLDVEFTTKQGHDVSSVENKVKEIAKAHDQAAAFLSRIHDDSDHPTARPITEMGFNKPATEAEIQKWAKAFEDYGLGGFTIARDSRGKALGIRSQATPEFAGIDPGEHKAYMRVWRDRLKELQSDPSLPWDNVTYNKERYADTKIFRKGEHY